MTYLKECHFIDEWFKTLEEETIRKIIHVNNTLIYNSKTQFSSKILKLLYPYSYIKRSHIYLLELKMSEHTGVSESESPVCSSLSINVINFANYNVDINFEIELPTYIDHEFTIDTIYLPNIEEIEFEYLESIEELRDILMIITNT